MYLFETMSDYLQGWPGTQGSPTSASQVQGLQVCATPPPQCNYILMELRQWSLALEVFHSPLGASLSAQAHFPP